MFLELTEEQALIQKTAKDFSDSVLWPRAAERDQKGTFPKEELEKLAQMGLLTINVPSSLGGAEAGVVAYALALEQIARGDASVAVAMSVTNMVAELICEFGSDEQKKEIQHIASGKHLTGAFALSEPAAGSDPTAMTTIAKLDGDEYVINGTKQWITNGGHAGLIVVWAKTESGDTPAHEAITCFLIPGDTKGLSVARYEEKMGLHGSTTAQLILENVRVPKSAILGKTGGGFKMAMVALDGGRIGIAAQAVGVASRALECSVEYAKERKTFGKPIHKHQAVGNMIANMATSLEASKLMVMKAASMKAAWSNGGGVSFSKQAAMTKVYATESAQKICDTAIQIHGGYGYVKDFPVERLYRDVRVTTIYEGTSEIQRMVIARKLIAEA